MGLTTEQRKIVDGVVAPIKAEAMRTDPIKQEECIAAFNAAYAEKNLPAPEYVFCTSPWDALQKVEARATTDNYSDILGEETFLQLLDSEDPAWDDPLYEAVSKRTEKMFMGFSALDNVVTSGVERYVAEHLNKWASSSLLYHGHNSSWGRIEGYAMSKALEALGVMKQPRGYILDQIALATCGPVHSFERCCFISERPESFHCPSLTKEGPRDRISAKWRDGFMFDDEY